MNHEWISGDAASGILILADHASNDVPAEIDLRIERTLLARHVAYDIGTAKLARDLAARLGAPAILGGVSRLVVDLNRAPDEAIPTLSDGANIPGNAALDDAGRAQRLAAFHAPYHDAVSARLAGVRLIVSVHSFTPILETRHEPRPWHVGLLYNRNDRAARVALDLLTAEGFVVGDNLPYSGQVYGYTTDRHAEANGIDYLTFEVRQDLLADGAAIAAWSARLERVVRRVELDILNEAETVSI